MRAKRGFLGAVVAASLFTIPFFACKNTIDINAKWKEIIVVYGLLDPLDTVQFVRVEKAFLNEKTGALQAAKISDSLELDSAVVTLTHPAGIPIVLQKVNYVPKNPGIFGTDKNTLWKTNVKIDSNTEYRIDVINPKSGNKVWATTNTVMSAQIISPIRNSSSKFSLLQEYISVDFIPRANTFAYDVTMTVYYDEFSKTDTSTKTSKVATWYMLTNQPVEAGVESRVLIPRLAFLQFLTSTITSDPDLKHRLKSLDMSWYGGNQTLVDYISVNQPSIGIVQKTAEYTNINGGYGIFASRCAQYVKNAGFDPNTINYIAVNPETIKLNIVP